MSWEKRRDLAAVQLLILLFALVGLYSMVWEIFHPKLVLR